MIIVLFRYKTRILFLNRVLRKLSSIIILNSSLLKHYFLRIIGSEVEVSCSHTHLPASTPLSLKRVDPLVLDPLLCHYQSNNQLASTCRPYHNYHPSMVAWLECTESCCLFCSVSAKPRIVNCHCLPTRVCLPTRHAKARVSSKKWCHMLHRIVEKKARRFIVVYCLLLVVCLVLYR